METTEQLRERQEREHFEKYDALAKKLGLTALAVLVPASQARIQKALAEGDEHLNTINLALWDKAVLGKSLHEREECYACGQKKPWAPVADWPYAQLRRMDRTFPWEKNPGLSLAERVCVLKHVAKNYPEFLAVTIRRAE